MTVRCGPRRVGAWCCLLAVVYVTSVLIEVSDAQAYHFSKGWMPGRKRSGSQLTGERLASAKSSVYGELDRRSAAQMCAIKSQSYRLALDILKEGFERLAEDCEVAAAVYGLSSVSDDDSFPPSSTKSQSK